MSERSFRRELQRRAESARRRAARRRRVGLAATATAGAFALSAPGAQAANFEVNTTADAAAGPCEPLGAGTDCTLRDAITLAAATIEADTITFASSVTGTIRLTQGQLSHGGNYDVTINGPGRETLTVSGDADGSGDPSPGDTRTFVFSGEGDATISGLTLADGFADYGGAIQRQYGGGLTVTDSRITNSLASDTNGGGAIYASSPVTITDSVIDSNEAAVGPGGAIAALARATVTDSTISGNTAATDGGAISADAKYAPVTLTDSVITGNDAARGGALYLDQDVVALGAGKYGGGGANTIIVRSTISGNDATASGGGIYVGEQLLGYNDFFPTVSEPTIFQVSKSTLSGNDAGAAAEGGAIVVSSTLDEATFDVNDSTISGNTAGIGAGVSFSAEPTEAQVTDPGSIQFDNSTIADNDAADRGGGLYLGAYDTTGGVSPPTSATIPLDSTIVGDNTPQDLDRADTSTGGGFPLGFSLVEAQGDAPIPENPAGSAIVGVDPQLAGLADNGGTTQTHMPARTGPVIDQGLARPGVTDDQRLAPRPFDFPDIANAAGGDGSDIGSVERGADPSPDTPVNPAATAPSTQIDKAPAKKIRTKKKRKRVEVLFTGSIPGSSFECRIDNGPFQPCASPLKVKVSSKPGKGRFHSISIRAIGPTGLVEQQPETVGFRVIRTD